MANIAIRSQVVENNTSASILLATGGPGRELSMLALENLQILHGLL